MTGKTHDKYCYSVLPVGSLIKFACVAKHNGQRTRQINGVVAKINSPFVDKNNTFDIFFVRI